MPILVGNGLRLTPIAAAGASSVNLLTANEFSIETDASGWSADNGNTTLTQDTAEFLIGTHSLKGVATAAGNVSSVLNRNVTVTPSQPYAVSYWAFTTLTGRQANLEVDWKSAGGGFVGFTDLSSQSLPLVTLTANTWTKVTITATPPIGLGITQATPIMIITAQGASENYWMDEIVFSPALTDPSGWVAGSEYFNTQYGLIRRFDGSNWGDAESASGFYYVPVSETVTIAQNRVCSSYYRSKTDGRVIVNGILSGSVN